MKKIFLTGGTGLLGKAFLKEISKEVFEIILGKRTIDSSENKYKQQYFNLEDNDLELNLKDIDIVVHLASNTRDLSSNADILGTKKLLHFIKKYKVKHLIYISIIGVDKVPIKYFRTKHKMEKLIQEKCQQYTILRSTQFFEFFEEEVKKQLSNKIKIIPNLKYQPIETKIVAKKIVEICKGKNTNSVIEMGGSEIILFKDAIEKYQKLKGNNSIIISIPNFLLGKMGKSLTTEHGIKYSKTWDYYLKEKEE